MEPAISLLIVDDDEALCSLMQRFFAQHGILAKAAHDGSTGLEAVLTGGFDVVVLDIMMPRMDGFEVLRRIRATSMIPIIMLTARTEQQDRVAGLDAGADDYLPKPFGPQELLARIRALLRRSRPQTNVRDTIDLCGIRLDPHAHAVWRDMRKVNLTSIEFSILEVLMRAAGRVVTRDQLGTTLFHRATTPRAIDMHISNLRKKLETRDQEFIITVRGLGYLFRSRPPS
jgi:two-component system response regulator CpxR